MSTPRQSRDDQYEAEVTDAEEIDAVDFPPDTALGVDDLLADDVPTAGDYAPDTLEGRERRLRPETAPTDGAGLDSAAPGGLTAADGPGEPDWEVVDPGGPFADSVSAAHHPSDTWSAEEAALHVETDEETPLGGGGLDDDDIPA
jgi:hypothetical protein